MEKYLSLNNEIAILKILNLNFINFRNLKDNKINLSEEYKCILWKNAQGKTSILEAIYFATLGISFRTRKAAEILKYETKSLGLFMEYENKIGKSSLSVKVHTLSLRVKNLFLLIQRRTQSDFWQCKYYSLYSRGYNHINGGPRNRRSFFDLEISQYDKSYLDNLRISISS